MINTNTFQTVSKNIAKCTPGIRVSQSITDVFVSLCVCVAAVSMNNLNDPPRWNIQPDPRGRGAGAGDGNQWNYALLVPMLGLAAFRKLLKTIISRAHERVK